MLLLLLGEVVHQAEGRAATSKPWWGECPGWGPGRRWAWAAQRPRTQLLIMCGSAGDARRLTRPRSTLTGFFFFAYFEA